MRGWATAVAASLPDLGRRHRVRVVADGETIHEGPMILTVASTTPFYGRGLLVNPGARPDAGQLTARIYTGPAPRMAAEAGRWASRRPPVAQGVAATRLTITSLTSRPIPVQADGDHMGEAEEWELEVRPAAVRLIGRWG
jgi:diacylglycerol kinase family enzyme